MSEKVEVLISAMHQTDLALLEKTGVTTDGLIINQCDENAVLDKKKNGKQYRMISVRERGLSRSRNMALKNAQGDYCLLCDDDERLYDGYGDKIVDAYKKLPNADIICFIVTFEGKKYSKKPYRIGYLKSLRVSSVQISLKLDSIKKAGILFDEEYGSGTSMGSGEENIFFFDCLKKGLKAYYVPVTIGEVNRTGSNWFKGYTDEYFLKRGAVIYRLMGKIGVFYCAYFAITKYRKYKKNMRMTRAFMLMMNGMKNHLPSGGRMQS